MMKIILVLAISTTTVHIIIKPYLLPLKRNDKDIISLNPAHIKLNAEYTS